MEPVAIRHMDLGIGLNVVRYTSTEESRVRGVIVALDFDDYSGSAGPLARVRWDIAGAGPLVTEVHVGYLLRIGRRLHWSGDPYACAEDCEGSHYGDHLEPGACCNRCGGSAYSCYVATEGRGCQDFTYRGRDWF